MKKVDLMTIGGLVIGTILIIVSMAAGGNLGLFWNLPSVGITIGGSFTALMIHYDLDRLKSIFKVVRLAFTTSLMNPQDLIDLFTELAKKARREGLLGLEDDMYRLNDHFFQKGIQMMVDAIDPELIRNILETDMEYTAARHENGVSVLRSWATLAPAFGMIGTLIGLIQMLANLNDPNALGPGMAVALITTFYGAIMANFVFIPIAGKLETRSQEELLLKSIILEGIIGIQSGMNPRILEEKLKAFLPKAIAPLELNPKRQQEGVAFDA